MSYAGLRDLLIDRRRLMNNLDNCNPPSDDSNSELLKLQAAIDAQKKKGITVQEIKTKEMQVVRGKGGRFYFSLLGAVVNLRRCSLCV